LYDPVNEVRLFARIAVTENNESAVSYSDVDIKFLNIFWRNFVIQMFNWKQALCVRSQDAGKQYGACCTKK